MRFQNRKSSWRDANVKAAAESSREWKVQVKSRSFRRKSWSQNSGIGTRKMAVERSFLMEVGTPQKDLNEAVPPRLRSGLWTLLHHLAAETSTTTSLDSNARQPSPPSDTNSSEQPDITVFKIIRASVIIVSLWHRTTCREIGVEISTG